MIFICELCKENRDFETEYGILIINSKNQFLRYCKYCRKRQVSVPDVYWDGKPEENLADDPNTGKPRIFASKFEKARYLKEKGLQEAGDKVHGAPPSIVHENVPRGTNGREEVKKALAFVKKMGRDYRHREYLRIMKSGEKFAGRID